MFKRPKFENIGMNINGEKLSNLRFADIIVKWAGSMIQRGWIRHQYSENKSERKERKRDCTQLEPWVFFQLLSAFRRRSLYTKNCTIWIIWGWLVYVIGVTVKDFQKWNRKLHWRGEVGADTESSGTLTYIKWRLEGVVFGLLSSR